MSGSSSWCVGARALVTGGSGGIGKAIASRLVKSGIKVVISGRNERALATIASELQCKYIVSDLVQPTAATDLIEQSVKALGGLEILVNNAGAGWAGYMSDMEQTEIEQLIALNLTAPLLLARGAVPQLQKSPRSAIVFIASIAGHLGVPGEAVYSAAKAGLVIGAEALAQEVSGQGTHVGVVSPGPVKTSFFENHGSSYSASLPKAISTDAVALATMKVIAHGRNELIIPRWLRTAALIRAISPETYRRAALKRTVAGLAVRPASPKSET